MHETMRYYFIANFPQQTSFPNVSAHLEFDAACFIFTSVAFPSSIVAAVLQFEVASLCLPTSHFVLLPYQWLSPFTLPLTITTVLLVLLSTYTYYQQSLNSEHIVYDTPSAGDTLSSRYVSSHKTFYFQLPYPFPCVGSHILISIIW